MNRRPLILLSPDFEIRSGRRGETPYYFMESSYGSAVWNAGGLPVCAPYTDQVDAIDDLMNHIDGLVLTGGDFDIDPSLFQEEPHPALGTLKPNRTCFEIQLYEGALKRQLPILGICGGMQLINVLRGGTLWQDLGTQCPSAMQHEQEGRKNVPGHDVVINTESGLYAFIGQEKLGVNSTHHQAIKTLGHDLIASATATDGIIEAFESVSESFLWGAQWHPEAMLDQTHIRLYEALVEAAKTRMSAAKCQ